MKQTVGLLFIASLLLAEQTPTPPKFRLADSVSPTRYALDMTIVPDEETFSGVADIDLSLRESTSIIWLHGLDLTVREATIKAGGRSVVARAITGNDPFLGFAVERPLNAGKATLHIAYNGRINSRSSAGIFRNKDDDLWYVFSQFESTDARRAFPCFDEPSFKVPVQLTLHVRRDLRAFSNTPQLAEREEPGGMKSVRFVETKPLPSYLVALAVGPFDVLDAGTAGVKRTPVRVITPKGKRSTGRYAAEVSPQILATLERYFQRPYPYEKLDVISVPLFPGAMENPGLITSGHSFTLATRDEETLSFQRGFANLAAHEFAHQWFGDLVTTAWWNDIWLNEAFASWMSAKVMQEMKPEWKFENSAASNRVWVMGQDSLMSARMIRQPIETNNDIADAFDGITYTKGAAVIHMFEHWIGADRFQKGVQAYLAKHAFGNATASQFLNAIDSAAGREVSPAFSTFLDQAGVPVLSAALTCAEGQAPSLELTQKRYVPLGSTGSAPQLWQIPVCFKYGDQQNARAECALLREPKATHALSSSAGCPAWVLMNDDQSGYYRTVYRAGLLDKLLADGGQRLNVRERVGLLSDVQAAANSGDMSAADALRLVPLFAGDANRQVVNATIDIVSATGDVLVSNELRPNYVRFVQKTYGDRARRLGWQSQSGEDGDTKLLRTPLVQLVADAGEDAALNEEAQRLARRWLDDRHAVAADVLEPVLNTAARRGDRSLYDRFAAELKKVTDEKERGLLIAALALFPDADLVRKNFEMLISGELDPREAVTLFFSPGNQRTRDVPFEFIKANYDRIAAKLPTGGAFDYASLLPYAAAGFCDEQHRTDVEQVFKERSAKTVGGPRTLAQVLESITLCSAKRTAHLAAAAEFLKQF